MSMKPSDRIKEIADVMTRETNTRGEVDIHIGEKAILRYLDEQYEKQQVKKRVKEEDGIR